MSENPNSLYASTPPVRLFFKVAVPGTISMFAMSIYSIIEGIFVGQFIGETAFAATNLVIPIIFINFSLADMVGVGSSIPISIAHGQQDDEKASNIFSCSVVLIVTIATILAAIMLIFAPLFMQWMGADAELAQTAVKYLRIVAALGPFTSLNFAMDNYLRICGYIRGSMLLYILSSVLQIVLLILFIPVLQWGLSGSALAVGLSMVVSVLLALIPFVRGKAKLKFRRPKFTLPLVREIFTCGMPMFLNNISGRLFSLVMNALLIRMGGTTAVAAFAVLMYCGDLVQPLLYGMCDSLQPAIGYNWGAAAFRRVRSLAKCVYTGTAAASILAFIVMFLYPHQLVSIFIDASDLALLEVSANALKLFSTMLLFRWFGYSAQSFYNAIEQPKNAAILSVSTALVFPLIMVVLLWPLGLNGLWLNQAATYIPVGVMAFVMLRRTQKSIASNGT